MSKRAVPVIRFADFSDVWKQHKFSEIFNILQNCTLSRAELSYEIGDVLNIHYGDVLIKYGEVINADTAVLPRIADPKIEAKYRSSELQDGDIIIADTAEDFADAIIRMIQDKEMQQIFAQAAQNIEKGMLDNEVLQQKRCAVYDF